MEWVPAVALVAVPVCGWFAHAVWADRRGAERARDEAREVLGVARACLAESRAQYDHARLVVREFEAALAAVTRKQEG